MSETTIVILTAMPHEYEAVRKRLSGLASSTHDRGTIFETGYLSGGCRIALTRTGVGNHPAAVTAERAAAAFAPAAIIFAGVAYALQRRLRLGDVVVATYVYAYHGATSEESGLKARPRTWELSYRARQIAEQLQLSGTWRRRLPAGPWPGPDAPRVVFGPVAAGEIAEYSAASAVRDWLHEHYNDAVAAEMEAAGVAEAGHMNDDVPTIMVRGICDYGDAGKPAADSAGWQQRAAASAAAFATALAVALAEDPGISRRSGGAGPGPEGPGPEGPGPEGPGPGGPGACYHNTTGDNSRIGVQGQHITINGGIHMKASRRRDTTAPGRQLGPRPGTGQARAPRGGPESRSRSESRIRSALRLGARIFRRVTEVATGVTAIITAIRSAT
jgi:adenosylhomocysteine nucleosidase